MVVGQFQDVGPGLDFHGQPFGAELLVRQECHQRHRLLLDLIQVAPGQCGFDRRIKATGGKGIGHLRQTLGLLLDGVAIGAGQQIT
ncbi:hypothetical protein D3C84_1221550 [compost metagenome]